MSSDLSRLAALDQDAPHERPVGRGRSRPVPDGPVANRRAVRRLGALAGLVAPAVSAVLGSLLLWGSDTQLRGIPGFTLLVAGAPIMPLTGVPASGGNERYLIAAVISAVLWLVIGAVAGHRATRLPIATWEDWRREYVPLALGASAGGLLAVGAWLVAIRVGWS